MKVTTKFNVPQLLVLVLYLAFRGCQGQVFLKKKDGFKASLMTRTSDTVRFTFRS